ncbi:hypothetical protein CEXT_569211 [Caerostris extrusa]|uniref:Uncharacterized protein n=1 Tax=Caerostris extrusa TaxID=172846 RepID=A0AAV4WNR7_CAEEX|nr:hypothetical protein CEXT_569211 [Caerostris extrusa]
MPKITNSWGLLRFQREISESKFPLVCSTTDSASGTENRLRFLSFRTGRFLFLLEPSFLLEDMGKRFPFFDMPCYTQPRK